MSYTMRRAHNHSYQPLPSTSSESNYLEEKNEELIEQLKDKVHTLKSLTIDISNEVQHQNKFLDEMGNDFERTGGFLGKTMGRVTSLYKGSHRYYNLYLFLFSVLVFFIIWMLIR